MTWQFNVLSKTHLTESYDNQTYNLKHILPSHKTNIPAETHCTELYDNPLYYLKYIANITI